MAKKRNSYQVKEEDMKKLQIFLEKMNKENKKTDNNGSNTNR